ncbi:hypothetical protein BGX23_002381 [Mortierella sp. AD031]|nr:hypothetical protein BGX23_002381 [Mortierella sp. AD031]
MNLFPNPYDIPVEILDVIREHLSPIALVKAMQVCTTWEKVYQRRVWRTIVRNDWHSKHFSFDAETTIEDITPRLAEKLLCIRHFEWYDNAAVRAQGNIETAFQEFDLIVMTAFKYLLHLNTDIINIHQPRRNDYFDSCSRLSDIQTRRQGIRDVIVDRGSSECVYSHTCYLNSARDPVLDPSVSKPVIPFSISNNPAGDEDIETGVLEKKDIEMPQADVPMRMRMLSSEEIHVLQQKIMVNALRRPLRVTNQKRLVMLGQCI